MKYIYSTRQMSKLSLTLYTFNVTSLVADLFLTFYYIDLTRKDNHQTNPEIGYFIYSWRLSITGLVYGNMNIKTGILL